MSRADSSDPFPLPPAGLFREVDGAYVARNAIVTGDVTLGRESSIWFNCVVRGDESPITIGDRTNIQDGTILHTDTGVPLDIAEDCTVGHAAMIHARTVGRGTLIGIKAVVLGGARVGNHCVVAAGAVVKENAVIPDHTLVAGVPARVIRAVGEKELEFMRQSVPIYIGLARRYLPDGGGG